MREAKSVLALSEQQAARFWSKVPERPLEQEACWNWMACRYKEGYGRLGLNSVGYLAHRVAYALAYGTIPQGCEIDHLCHNRKCVRPGHLEAVPRVLNQQRSWSRDGRVPARSRNTHCLQGHEYSEENTLWRISQRGRPYRRCRTCEIARDRARRRKG